MNQNKNQTLSSQRKNDHAHLAMNQQKQAKPSVFENIRFIHHSLNQVHNDKIDLSTTWGGHTHQLPFYINGMTGGTAETGIYNQQLAEVAHQTGLTMAVGSMSITIKDATTLGSFTVARKYNPNGFLMANLGAHHTVATAKKVVEAIEANAIQIHLNIPQEVVMPEGDRDFSMWLDHIHQMVTHLPVPVIVKEVGFGMSGETIEKLLQAGVKTVDISGRGGTNFIQIENARRTQLDFSDIANWGQTTAESLMESLAYQNKLTILASGGIKQVTDILYALALGARAVGLGGFMLKKIKNDGVDATVLMIKEWQAMLKQLMLLVGAESLADLRQTDLLVTGDLLTYANQRGIDTQHLARRSRNI